MIDVLVDDGIDDNALPDTTLISQALLAACREAGYSSCDPEVCIRFAGDADIRALNRQWRHQDKVTDVLSFPLQEGPDFDVTQPLGDIALAMPFVLHEAERLGVPTADHCLHLIVHAGLHLLGFDHVDEAQAQAMQRLEQQAMHRLGLHDPYPETSEAHP